MNLKYLFSLTLFLFFIQDVKSQWTQLGLPIDGANANDQLGYEVSLNSAGDRFAVGVPYRFNKDAGQVIVYEYDSGAWSQLGNSIDGDKGGDRCGWAMAMNATGDVVAMGCPFFQ